jgi:hypothetical protein
MANYCRAVTKSPRGTETYDEKFCGYAISILALLRNWRIFNGGMSVGIFIFAICGLKNKVCVPTFHCEYTMHQGQLGAGLGHGIGRSPGKREIRERPHLRKIYANFFFMVQFLDYIYKVMVLITVRLRQRIWFKKHQTLSPSYDLAPPTPPH